ncbi:MAG: OmpA family protein [Limibacillus sp.]|jgi:outer membrane protein OmpA-like peptidoglycan-associated protein
MRLAIASLLLFGLSIAPAFAATCDGVNQGSTSVYFDVGSTTVKDADRPKLERFAERAVNFRYVCILGFADKQGDPAVNERISKQRAETVRKILVDLGVKPEAIAVETKGEAFGAGNLFGLGSDAEEDRRVTVTFGN